VKSFSVESFATTIPAPARSFGQIISIQISTSAVPSSTQAIDEEVEQLLASGGSLPECFRFQEAFEMYRTELFYCSDT